MSEQFDIFISQLSKTNTKLNYFTDFEKIKKNVNRISIKLHQLNYLIGKDDLAQAVRELYSENPKAFEVLSILIAVRNEKSTKVFNKHGEIVVLEDYFKSPDDILEFLEETGLGDTIVSKEITNFVDYVFGIEVGLDTNARKNRTGSLMATEIALLFDKYKIKYQREVSSIRFPEIISLGVDKKVFDFVVRTKRKTYLVEANFYNGGGSKLNETARSYTELAQKINQYSNFEFVWITDGKGWLSAKNKLEQAFSIIPKMYNLSTFDSFIIHLKQEGAV